MSLLMRLDDWCLYDEWWACIIIKHMNQLLITCGQNSSHFKIGWTALAVSQTACTRRKFLRLPKMPAQSACSNWRHRRATSSMICKSKGWRSQQLLGSCQQLPLLVTAAKTFPCSQAPYPFLRPPLLPRSVGHTAGLPDMPAHGAHGSWDQIDPAAPTVSYSRRAATLFSLANVGLVASCLKFCVLDAMVSAFTSAVNLWRYLLNMTSRRMATRLMELEGAA